MVYTDAWPNNSTISQLPTKSQWTSIWTKNPHPSKLTRHDTIYSYHNNMEHAPFADFRNLFGLYCRSISALVLSDVIISHNCLVNLEQWNIEWDSYCSFHHSYVSVRKVSVITRYCTLILAYFGSVSITSINWLLSCGEDTWNVYMASSRPRPAKF